MDQGVNNTYEEEGLADEFLNIDNDQSLHDQAEFNMANTLTKQNAQKSGANQAYLRQVLGFDEHDPRLSNIDDAHQAKQENDSDLQKSAGSVPDFEDEDDDDAGDLQKQLDQIKNDLGKSQAIKAKAKMDYKDEGDDDEQDDDAGNFKQSTIANLISKYQQQLKSSNISNDHDNDSSSDNDEPDDQRQFKQSTEKADFQNLEKLTSSLQSNQNDGNLQAQMQRNDESRYSDQVIRQESARENDNNDNDIDFDSEMDYIRRLKEKLTQNQNLGQLSQDTTQKQANRGFDGQNSSDNEPTPKEKKDASDDDDDDDTQEMLEESQFKVSEDPNSKSTQNYDFLAQLNKSNQSGVTDPNAASIGKYQSAGQGQPAVDNSMKMKKYDDLSSSDDDDDNEDTERERILQEKLKFYREKYGNPSSKLGGAGAKQTSNDDSHDSDTSSDDEYASKSKKTTTHEQQDKQKQEQLEREYQIEQEKEVLLNESNTKNPVDSQKYAQDQQIRMSRDNAQGDFLYQEKQQQQQMMQPVRQSQQQLPQPQSDIDLYIQQDLQKKAQNQYEPMQQNWMQQNQFQEQPRADELYQKQNEIFNVPAKVDQPKALEKLGQEFAKRDVINLDDEDEIDNNSKEEDEESLALTQSYLTNIGGAGFMSAGLQQSQLLKGSIGPSAQHFGMSQMKVPNQHTPRQQMVVRKDKLLHRVLLLRQNRELLKTIGVQKFLFNLYNNKLFMASQMVQRVSNMSKGYIVAQTVAKIFIKNQMKRRARAFRKFAAQSLGKQLKQVYDNQSMLQRQRDLQSQKHDDQSTDEIRFERDQLKIEISQLKQSLQQQKQDNFQGLEVLKQRDNELRYLQQQLHRREEEAIKQIEEMQKDAMSRSAEAFKEKDNEIWQLQQQLKNKEADLQKMETMFKEYSSWRQKLEVIEQKMKQEVDYWKQTAEKVQKENEKLQKDLLQLSQEQMTKTRELAARDETIKTLREQLEKQGNLETVEEALCPQCKRSMEESIHVNTVKDQENIQKIEDLTQKNGYLQKQIVSLQERNTFLETVESEQKKELEEHIEVMLKMEQERLLLLKENQKVKEEKMEINIQNTNYKDKLQLFETHLTGLRDEITQQQTNLKKIISEKDEEIDQLNAELEQKQNQITQLQKTKKIPQKMTMTGLPQSVVQQKQKQMKQGSEATLKFKFKKGEQSLETQSVMSSTTTASNSMNQFSDRQLVHDNQTLTSELLVVTQNFNKSKQDLKKSQDAMKKLEKDLFELQKQLEGKENALEKLRKDRDDLWAMVNTDKYKNFKSFDEEKQKFEKTISDLQSDYELIQADLQAEQEAKSAMEQELQNLTSQNKQLYEADQSQKLLLQQLREKNDRNESQIAKSESLQKQTTELLEQLKNENDKLKVDVTWLANSAKNSKIQSEKAISDLEEYNKILKMMDSKLKQTERERDGNKKECIELQNCLNQLIQQVPQLKNQMQKFPQQQQQPQPQPYPSPQPSPQAAYPRQQNPSMSVSLPQNVHQAPQPHHGGGFPQNQPQPHSQPTPHSQPQPHPYPMAPKMHDMHPQQQQQMMHMQQQPQMYHPSQHGNMMNQQHKGKQL